jgi:hypothetical protein
MPLYTAMEGGGWKLSSRSEYGCVRFINELFTQFDAFDELHELCIALKLSKVLFDYLFLPTYADI